VVRDLTEIGPPPARGARREVTAQPCGLETREKLGPSAYRRSLPHVNESALCVSFGEKPYCPANLQFTLTVAPFCLLVLCSFPQAPPAPRRAGATSGACGNAWGTSCQLQYPLATVLVIGPPGLRCTLQLTVHEAFTPCLAVRYRFGPLDIQETIGQIRHQLRVAGASQGTLIIDDALAHVFD